MMIQFIQQHDETPSIYRDKYQNGEEGYHHIGVLVSDFDKRVYISQSYFAKEYEIPKDYISDKLKPPFNWKTSEIWANYKHLKK